MSLMSQFLIPGSSPDGQYVLDRAKFRAFASAHADKVAAREGNHLEVAVEKMNRALASAAGVAQINSVEADYEVLNIFRDSVALDFMETRNWPLGSIAIFRTKTLNPVNVLQAGILGVGPTQYYATSQTVVQVAPVTYTTERVMTPNLNSLYDMAKLQERKDSLMRLDTYLEIGLNNMCLNTVFANPSSVNVVTDDPAVSIVNYFGTGGSFAGQNVYVLDPGVIPAGVPTVNVYDLTSEGGITKKVVQTVNTHSMQIGRDFKTMYIPQAATSGNSPVWESLQNMATPVALITGTGLNNSPAKAIPSEMWSEFQKEDFRGAIRVNWFGLSLDIKKQNWLPAGYCILFCDEPASLMWDRLALESGNPMDGTLETPADGFYNYRSRSKQIALARPGYCLRNFLVLKVQ